MTKVLLIGSDHNGKKLKDFLIKKLKNKYNMIDFGNFHTKEKVDYTDISQSLSYNISNNPNNFRGILICGTGVGMSIAANKIKRVKAVIAHSKFVAEMSRRHNSSNVICLGSWVNSNKKNFEIINVWLNSNFDKGRHIKRIDKLEKNYSKIVMVNGVFDIIHSGHIDLLNHAKTLGQKLVVALNSDRSTKIIKGNQRPINSEEIRKKTLLNLRMVDEVVLFDEINLSKVINLVKPNLLVRGNDHSEREVRKKDKIPKYVEIKIIKKTFGYSTTKTIKKIKS